MVFPDFRGVSGNCREEEWRQLASLAFGAQLQATRVCVLSSLPRHIRIERVARMVTAGCLHSGVSGNCAFLFSKCSWVLRKGSIMSAGSICFFGLHAVAFQQSRSCYSLRGACVSSKSSLRIDGRLRTHCVNRQSEVSRSSSRLISSMASAVLQSVQKDRYESRCRRLSTPSDYSEIFQHLHNCHDAEMMRA